MRASCTLNTLRKSENLLAFGNPHPYPSYRRATGSKPYTTMSFCLWYTWRRCFAWWKRDTWSKSNQIFPTARISECRNHWCSKALGIEPCGFYNNCSSVPLLLTYTTTSRHQYCRKIFHGAYYGSSASIVRRLWRIGDYFSQKGFGSAYHPWTFETHSKTPVCSPGITMNTKRDKAYSEISFSNLSFCWYRVYCCIHRRKPRRARWSASRLHEKQDLDSWNKHLDRKKLFAIEMPNKGFSWAFYFSHFEVVHSAKCLPGIGNCVSNLLFGRPKFEATVPLAVVFPSISFPFVSVEAVLCLVEPRPSSIPDRGPENRGCRKQHRSPPETLSP